LSSWLAERALEGILPEQLYQRAEQLLKTWHIVLPAVSTVERLVDSISARAKEEFYEFISSRLSNKLKKTIDELLTQTDSERKTSLFHLKEYPRAANATQLLEYIEHFELLDSILGDDFDTGVDFSMQKHLAQLVKRYDAAALKKLKRKKKYALIACFLAESRKTILDHIVALHDQYMTETTRKCKNKHDKKLKEGRRRARHGMSIVLDATEIMVDATVPVDERVGVLFEKFDEDRLRDALNNCRQIQRVEERGFVDELCAHYSALRRYFPRFLMLDFECSVGLERTLEAIKLARTLNTDEKQKLPSTAPTEFVPAAWNKAMRKADGSFDRRVWEIALSLAIKEGLRSGDLHLARSRKHVSFWNLVYDENKWNEEKPNAYAALALPAKANDLLIDLQLEYTNAVTTARAELATNSFVTINDQKLHLKRIDALEIPQSAKQLRAVIETNLRRIRIEDLLQEVDQLCGFTREFRPLGGYKSRITNLYITVLANLIAQGTNLGIAAMANSVDELTADMLQHVHQWFFGFETQKAVNANLVDYHGTLPLSSLYGSGEFSSSDGQRFGVQRSSLLASLYPRYFGYYDRAISLYTHISDQYSVFSTQAISCGPREALYVLDGLLDNQTTLRPREHTTDTHGFTEQLFGLCYLLGVSFMPRLKDLPDQRLYKFDNTIDMGELEPIFEAPVDKSLIIEQWDQLVRVAASLKHRVAPAHVVLHRLVNASPSDRVAKALTALGRLVKTVYLLRYISDPALRRKVQKQLNRGESRHDLAQVIFFADRGEFRTGDYDEIMN
ncbi:MAG: Tn3 family transposase, partial [Candidatus Obscuribacterales bacterium]|nr:Tn3 family transposase [Candidatus Obscuribacterales bacterium]